jgi:hypothetical protein
MLLKSPNNNSYYLVVFVDVASQFHRVYIVANFEYNEMVVVVVVLGLVVHTDIHIEVGVWELYMRIVFELVVDNEYELLEIHP